MERSEQPRTHARAMSEEGVEPLRLDQIGADALQCVLLANDTFERDALFVALTSTTLLEAVRCALHERDKRRRRAWFLIPRKEEWARKLVTSVDGVYCSASRIEFCKFHLSAQTLPAANALGHQGSCELRFPGIALTTVPTEALHAFVKNAPTDLVLRYFRPKDVGNFGGSREWRGMLMFSAMYGRVDVLEGLTDYDDELDRCTPWQDTLFRRPAIDRLLACPDARAQVPNGQKMYDELVTVLIRPALLGRQPAVLGWVQKVSFACAKNFARRDPDMRFPADEHRIEFAGMYVTRETMVAHTVHDGGLYQLRLAILDAVTGDFEVPFVRAIEQIVERWTSWVAVNDEEDMSIDLRWMGELALLLVTRVLMTRNGRGRLMKTLVELCRKHRVALREMWQLGWDPEAEFNLLTIARAVGNMPAQHFEDVTSNALWHMTFLPGDTAYNEWVLSELFERDASTSWLARPWGFSSADATELDVATVCRRFLDDQTHELLYAYRETRAPALVGSQSTYHFFAPEAVVYTTRMMRWEWPLGPDPEPCELQRAIAVAAFKSMEHTLACENPHVGESPLENVHPEVDAAMQVATIALLPHMQRLYERFASNKACRAPLRKLVLDLAVWWLGSMYACGYRKGGVVSHLVMAYKHGIFSRERFDQRVERTEQTGKDVDTHRNMHNGDRVAQVAALEDLRRRFATIDAELGRACRA